MDQILFFGFSAVAIGSAAGVVLNLRNAVGGALSLVLCMLALACLYVMLQSHFIGLIQVMVYAGAIVVLFLFVIMLLAFGGDPASGERQPLLKLGGIAVAVGAAVKLASLLAVLRVPWAEVPPEFGTTRELGLALYTDYLLTVQIAGVLLLAGIVGAVVLAKRDLDR
jgi:NADH-quinone oxidoreductase subunit J